MSVCRVEKTQDFTIMSNNHLQNKELSLKAKGLLSVVLSLPDEWDYSINGLVAICKEKRTSVETTLKELKEFGYLDIIKYTPDKTDSGRFEYEYVFYEDPKQHPDFLCIENQHIEILHIENQQQLNTNQLSTKKEKTKGKREKNIKKATSTKYSILEKVPTLCLEYDIEDEKVLGLLEEFFKVNIDAKNMVNEYTIRGSLSNLAKTSTDKQIKTIKLGLERGWKNLNPDWLDNTYKSNNQEHLQLTGQTQEEHEQFLEQFKNSDTETF